MTHPLCYPLISCVNLRQFGPQRNSKEFATRHRQGIRHSCGALAAHVAAAIQTAGVGLRSFFFNGLRAEERFGPLEIRSRKLVTLTAAGEDSRREELVARNMHRND